MEWLYCSANSGSPTAEEAAVALRLVAAPGDFIRRPDAI
jgi:hypothetical protein